MEQKFFGGFVLGVLEGLIKRSAFPFSPPPGFSVLHSLPGILLTVVPAVIRDTRGSAEGEAPNCAPYYTLLYCTIVQHSVLN